MTHLVARMIADAETGKEEERQRAEDELEEFSPFKHVVFKFTMSSVKLAFILQNELPIWVLGVVSMYLFYAFPDPANRCGNAILVLVSQIALLIEFRMNNISHHTISFFELKMMVMMTPGILVVISTVHDFYQQPNPFDPNASQLDNPFMLVSLIIVCICAGATFFFFVYIFIVHNCSSQDKKQRLKDFEQNELWENMEEF